MIQDFQDFFLGKRANTVNINNTRGKGKGIYA
jgi:hypothetical protein